MKFDLIISNPPYNNSLDLKILKEVYPLGNRFCLVHPASWIYDNKMKNKLFNDSRELVKDHFVSWEKVEDACKLFKINIFTDVFITLFDKNKEGIGEKIYDIDVHGQTDIYKSLKKKVLNYCKNQNLLQRVSKENCNSFEVGFSGIRGSPGGPDFYTFLQKTNEKMHYGKSTKYYWKFGFNTENEIINFKDYLKLKLVRFCLSIYKFNQTIHISELPGVPYMPDYTKPWTDESVAKELGLTPEELSWAINWIPDYYTEDAEKYAKYKN